MFEMIAGAVFWGGIIHMVGAYHVISYLDKRDDVMREFNTLSSLNHTAEREIYLYPF